MIVLVFLRYCCGSGLFRKPDLYSGVRQHVLDQETLFYLTYFSEILGCIFIKQNKIKHFLFSQEIQTDWLNDLFIFSYFIIFLRKNKHFLLSHEKVYKERLTEWFIYIWLGWSSCTWWSGGSSGSKPHRVQADGIHAYPSTTTTTATTATTTTGIYATSK